MEDQGSPKGAKDEGLGHENQDEEMMEEFLEDSSFEEWTGTFLGRESLGCGVKLVEEGETGAGSCVASQDEGEEASKDNLDDNLEFMDRTVSLICKMDPSHPRVTEPEENDSMVGVSWAKETQDGDQGKISISTVPERTDQAPGETLEPTAGHTREVGCDQVVTDRQFEECEGLVLGEDNLLNSNGLDMKECATQSRRTDQT